MTEMDDRAVARPKMEDLSQRRRRLVVVTMHLCLAVYAGVGAFAGDGLWVLLSVGALLGAIIGGYSYLLQIPASAR